MSKKFNYDTRSENLSDLLTPDRKFIVPKYQRDYSWEVEQWNDLWDDIIDLDEKNNYHYMGYLVLKRDANNDKEFYIIDGQQRLTTISILILAVIKEFEKIQNKDYQSEGAAKNIYDLYIGTKDMITSKTDTKLQLNRNNNDYYRNYLTTYKELKKMNYSWKQMYDCYSFFLKKIDKQFNNELQLYSLMKKIDSLLFTTMLVDDEVNAYSIFETLNARGMELSTTDLLKNYLFSIVDREDALKLDDLESKWKEIIDSLPDSIEISDLFSIYWNGKEKICKENNLFKEIRKKVINAKDVFDLLNDLCEKAKSYYIIVNPWDSYWNDKGDCKEYLDVFKRMHITQIYSMLIFAIDILNVRDFEKLLKYLVIICFRYNTICGQDPKVQSVNFNELSIDMNRNNKFDFEKLKKALYIEDSTFEEMFKNAKFTPKQNNIVKYILKKIEIAKYGNKSYDENSLSIEHVLPKNISSKWDYTQDFYDEYALRLGNLFLLENNINKDCDNKSFKEKKKIYKNSIIPSINEIAKSDSDVWDNNSIVSRQLDLAKIAKGIWCI